MGGLQKKKIFFACTLIIVLLSSSLLAGWGLDITQINVPFIKNFYVPILYHYKNTTDLKVVFFALHDNEYTSKEAAKEIVNEKGGEIFELKNREKRLIEFKSFKRRYKIDPNRIFTPRGLRQNIIYYNKRFSSWAYNRVRKLGQRILKQYPLREAQVIVGLHNNTDRGYSVISYKKGFRLGRNAKLVYINSQRDKDDFFIVTQKRFYNYFKNRGFNVVLQNNRRVKDDGSLSIYCARYGIPYISVEAQFDHIEEQKEMIRAIYDFCEQEYITKSMQRKNNITIYVSEKKLKANINDFKKEYIVSTGARNGQKLWVKDLRTPVGRYKVAGIENSTKWKYRGQAGSYGPWFIRLGTRWRGIGIHGTHNEETIGYANSLGCIRMRNNDIKELAGHVYRGLDVVILP